MQIDIISGRVNFLENVDQYQRSKQKVQLKACRRNEENHDAYFASKYFPNQNPEKTGLNVRFKKKSHIRISLRKLRKQKKRKPVASA
jgi:hypothetical protein